MDCSPTQPRYGPVPVPTSATDDGIGVLRYIEPSAGRMKVMQARGQEVGTLEERHKGIAFASVEILGDVTVEQCKANIPIGWLPSL